MEAGLARLGRQPDKWDEFFLCLYEKIHPACWDNFIILIFMIFSVLV
jgi:hypothetical protein